MLSFQKYLKVILLFLIISLISNCSKRISSEDKIKSDEYLVRALDYAKQNDIQQSIICLNNSIQLNPYNAKAYKYRAMYERNNHEQALNDFNKCIELDSIDYVSYFYRALLKENEFKDINGALLDLDKAITLNNKYVEAYHSRGRIKFNKKDYKNAITDLKEAHLMDFSNTDIMTTLGQSLYYDNQRELGCYYLIDACEKGNENACLLLKISCNCKSYNSN